MAHPEECAHVELHRTAARPSFSIMAVPHMVLYGCPSSCPVAEHMLEPERESVLFCISCPNRSS